MQNTEIVYTRQLYDVWLQVRNGHKLTLRLLKEVAHNGNLCRYPIKWLAPLMLLNQPPTVDDVKPLIDRFRTNQRAKRAKYRQLMISKRNIRVPEHKTCYHCQQLKPRTEFYSNTHSPDGLQSWCKTCVSEYGRQKREKATNTRDCKHLGNNEIASFSDETLWQELQRRGYAIVDNHLEKKVIKILK